MKRYLLLILLGACFIRSDAQWKKMTTPTIKDLYDAQVIDHIVYAVGNSGVILKSNDTGKSWKSLAFSPGTNLRALCFLDSNIGLVIGENAKIHKTLDGGKTWTQKYIRTAAYGYDMASLNNHVIAVGNNMLAISSVDSGNTWTVDTTLSKNKKLNSVAIMPDGNCWAVGDTGYLLNKNVNSRKWKVVKYPTKVDLNHVSCIGNNIIVIAGGMPDSAVVGKYFNILLMSTDTGKTWQQTAVGTMKIINSAFYKNQDTGFLAGSNGIISKCNSGIFDRGVQISGSASSLNKIIFSNEIGLVVGDGGTVLRTTNNGGKVLSLSKVEKNNSLVTLSPNPCNTAFKLRGQFSGYEVTILNNIGQLVYENKAYLTGEDIVLYSEGLYTLLAKDLNGNVSVQKLIVLTP